MEKNHKKWGGVLSIKSILQIANKMLENVSESPALDAELLLAHCLDKNRTHLHTWPESKLDKTALKQFEKLINQRINDVPVAYLLGKQPFWTLELKVTPDVLIPRPETELLVETALKKIRNLKNPQVLDLGTGSGAIALAIASERPDAVITATDVSKEALDIAQENAKLNQLSHVQFIESDWFNQLPQKQYDLIVSNPPYIDPDDPHLSQSIRHEPLSALVAEQKGIKDLQTIIENGADFLTPNGWLIVEHGYNQGEQTRKLFLKNHFQKVETSFDLNKNERITLGQI